MLTAESEALHQRVRRFARSALQGTPPPEAFDELALAIARHQLAHSPVAAALARYQRSREGTLGALLAVPADAFRRGRVAAHPAAEDVAYFQTSGTTGGAGAHAFRTLETYRELSVAWGRRALLPRLPAGARVTVLALAPPFRPARRSSLGFMLEEFMRCFDGRPLDHAAELAEPTDFDPLDPGRWLLASGAVDVAGLQRGVELAERRGEPVLLLATSFALAWLLEALGGERLALPTGSVVMHTGGFKGHAQTLEPAELAERVISTLALSPRSFIGEYGMTELSSQLYDGGFSPQTAVPGVFIPPPWLRVTPVDPIRFEPVAKGAVGLARFTDLANVDSALCVLTQDQVREVSAGVALLGRRPGARLRGCSLAVEELAKERWRGAPPQAGPA